jgi:protein phosphatase inhibitor 2
MNVFVGILKNSSSCHRSPPHKPVTVIEPSAPVTERAGSTEATDLTERDIVLQNTLQNAGRRRSSSNQSRTGTGSRRHSHHDDPANAEGSPRLKWDEANLYLTEQERTPKMKIDEPKTPFAKGYDPMQDEEELRMLDAEDIAVDELDEKPKKHAFDMRIPDLDIGEPETAPEFRRRESHSPKQVVVKEDVLDGHLHMPGDDPETPEEEEKHKQFEEARKKHYEMKNVANLLG